MLDLYLAITSKVISSILCSKRNNNMKSLYYVSHVLNGPEERYSSLGKYILCLVITARKLKPYFQAHTINIQILHFDIYCISQTYREEYLNSC